MRPVTVVTLSRFPEIFAGLQESMDREARSLSKFVVWDGPRPNGFFDDRDGAQSEWLYVEGQQPFKIARNANAGWSCAKPLGNDVLYCGDDTRIIEPGTMMRLCEVAEEHPDFGIIAPRILNQDREHSEAFTVTDYVPFVFVLIRADVIAKVGYMDERFEGYGVDDLDYCVRTRMAGFKIAYANSVHIQHGVGGVPWGSTFKRVKTEKQMLEEDTANWCRFADKYSLPHDRQNSWQFVRDCDKVHP